MTTNHDHLREMPLDADTLIAAMARINTLQDELAALRKENEGLRNLNATALLRDLVHALDNAFISSWQSTAAWQAQLDAARAAIGDSHE